MDTDASVRLRLQTRQLPTNPEGSVDSVDSVGSLASVDEGDWASKVGGDDVGDGGGVHDLAEERSNEPEEAASFAAKKAKGRRKCKVQSAREWGLLCNVLLQFIPHCRPPVSVSASVSASLCIFDPYRETVADIVRGIKQAAG
ncbi:hypothetical protein Daus18300_009515 [Diaporthe australafricana]|uniref:Uncharacterized protein n=1 Tax=Diaporthe australafricana TaxID=127596 RepID=A0ABR3WE91_9PEZI